MHACLAVVKSVSYADLYQLSFFMGFILSADCFNPVAMFMLSTVDSLYSLFLKLRYLNLRYQPFSQKGVKVLEVIKKKAKSSLEN